MKTKEVPFSWIKRTGMRLDSGPYLGGAVEARMLLANLSCRKDHLIDVTAGHDGGIFNGPKFSRIWVDGPKYGVPFVGSSSMLHADLSNLPYLQREYAESRKLSHLKIQEGMTLISCSGTIGNMVYARPDMDGIWSSQHIMKVVPDESKIPPGYLYAYLSSKFGIPMITSGTYGAIIQHIEPEHIADLSVPRLGHALESDVSTLVEEAACNRAEANAVLQIAIKDFDRKFHGLPLAHPSSPYPHGISIIKASQLSARMDAFFHSPYHAEARATNADAVPVSSFANAIIEPNRLKRVKVDEDSGGTPFFGTTALFWATPKPSYWIPAGLAENFMISPYDLLIPRSGQVSGIIGKVAMLHSCLSGAAVSEDAIRVRCPDQQAAGYLFIALSSETGLRQLKARTYGSSIPHLDIHQIGAVEVPDACKDDFDHFGRAGIEIARLRTAATEQESQARYLLESAIEKAAHG